MSGPARILIVDDEPFNVDYLEQELDDLGFQTQAAADGEEALRMVEADPPDLILLDVIMPGLDGITVCSMLKENPATRLIPVVIMTALEAAEDRIRGIEAGADDYLTKPVDDRELLARINTALRQKQAVDRALGELDSARAQLERLGKHDEDVTAVVLNLSAVGSAEPLDGSKLTTHAAALVAELEERGAQGCSPEHDRSTLLYRNPEPAEHTAQAVASAATLLRRWRDSDRYPSDRVELAIGVESGSALVGSARTGSDESRVWELTAEGPAVDTASSLATRSSGTAVVLGPEAHQRVEGRFELVPVDKALAAPEDAKTVILTAAGPDEDTGSIYAAGTPSQGIPWPHEYERLLERIREEWGVEGEIYLTRALSGKSSARVFAVDLTCAGFSGQAILKLGPAADPSRGEDEEAVRHERAAAAAPAFAGARLPRIVHTCQHQGQVAALATIAGRGLEYVLPWSHSPYDRQLVAARAMAGGILDGWNDAYDLAAGLKSPQELLEGWLGYRLDPDEGRIFDFLRRSGVDPLEPTIIVEGHWYPNPYAFARDAVPSSDGLRLRAVTGHLHGDLHGFNVLVNGRGDEIEYYVIDLAFYTPDSYLLYDHAYFELSHLLHVRETAQRGRWLSILDAIAGRTPPDADDLGLVQIVETVRNEVAAWVDSHEADRLSYLETQYLLARVAAGLNFTNKRVGDTTRGLAYLYAASNLKSYLKFHDANWPRQGQPLVPATGGEERRA